MLLFQLFEQICEVLLGIGVEEFLRRDQRNFILVDDCKQGHSSVGVPLNTVNC